MKHFLLEGEHTASFEERTPELISAHHQFLQEGCNKGQFLLSGQTIPPTGGILVARARSLEVLRELLAGEPYCKANVMQFKTVTEFDPIQHQFLLSDWSGKYSG